MAAAPRTISPRSCTTRRCGQPSGTDANDDPRDPDEPGGDRGAHALVTEFPQLFGRDDELVRLEGLLAEARPPLVVVYGEAGIGKTALASELARRARRQGRQILGGTCHEGTPQPFGPWLEALTAFVESLPPEQLADRLGPDAAVLAEVVPAIRERLPGLEDAPAIGPLDARFRLYDAVASVLDGGPRLNIVVLDDIQWADPSTLELLLHVARASARVMIILTYRGIGLGLDDPVTQCLARVQRVRRCEYVALAPLTIEASRQLLAVVSRRRVAERCAEILHRDAAGNPFFLAELARHLGSGETSGRRTIPDSVRAAISLRLAEVTHQTREVLELASVFSSGFTSAELDTVTSAERAELDGSLEDARAAGLLHVDTRGRYDFSHALVRHALYDRLSPNARARLHRRVAQGLVRGADGHLTSADAVEIARHYHASAMLGGAHQGVRYAVAAADQARSAYAPAVAAELLEMALEMADADDLRTRAELLSSLAVAQAEANREDAACQTLEHAVDALDRSGAPVSTIADLVYHVGGLLFIGLADPIAALVTEALARLDDHRDLRWARLRLYARPLATETAGPVRIARWSLLDEDARRIVREQGTELDYARSFDQTDPSPSQAAELLEMVDGWQDEAAQLYGYLALTGRMTLHGLGDMAAAERGCARGTTVARRSGHLPGVALTSLFRAVLLGRSGRLCDAIAAAEEAHEVSERLPPNAWMPTTASFFRDLTAQHLEPDWERIAAEHWAAATSLERVHWYGLSYAALAGLAHARAGEEAGARRVARQIMPAVARGLPCEPSAQFAAAMVAEIAWVLRDPALATSVEPHMRRLHTGGVGDGYMTLYELTIARLRALHNDLGGAGRSFQAARERLDSHGERPLRAIVDFDEALARAHRDGTAPAALLESARRRFAELGMTVWEGRAAELAARTPHAPSGLSKRETEVLQLLATGMTNRQIADALVVSVHTVERHVNNLYRKIGARNRADAAAFAVRSGL